MNRSGSGRSGFDRFIIEMMAPLVVYARGHAAIREIADRVPRRFRAGRKRMPSTMREIAYHPRDDAYF
jgi:hypothetical protein